MPHQGDKKSFFISTDESKFYILEMVHVNDRLQKPWHIVSRYGKAGSAGRRRVSAFGSQWRADDEFRKRTRRMTAAGYKTSTEDKIKIATPKKKQSRDLYGNRFSNLEL